MLDQTAIEVESVRKYEVIETNWRAIHRRLREHAQHRASLDAAESFDLVQAEKMRLHLNFGYVTLFEYMERELGYGPHAARERMRVARALVGLPHTTAALARGALTFSAARELTRVVTQETEEEWLAKTIDKTAHEIEELVSGRAQGDLPEDPRRPDLRRRPLNLKLPPEAYALWREARKVLADERGGGDITDADLFETVMRQFLKPNVEGPAHLIAYKQCLDCKRATQNGAGRELDVAPHVIERAACDAKIMGSLDAPSPERMTSTVTPRMRAEVLARDNYRCTVPGCRSSRNVDVHHITPQALGGKQVKSNLTTTCGGHHGAVHDGFLTMEGHAPYEIRFEWIYGPPSAPLTEEELEAQRTEEVFWGARLPKWLRDENRKRRFPELAKCRPNASAEGPHGTSDERVDHETSRSRVGHRTNELETFNVPRGTSDERA